MYSWYESWKDEDFIKSCGIKNTEGALYFSMSMAELAVIIVLAVALLMNYLNKKEPEVGKKQPQRDLVEREGEEPEKEGRKMVKESLLSDDIE